MADGSDLATVTVSVRDGTGKPVSGVQVQLSASGTSNTLSSPPPTDASGLTTATLSTTVAEAKTLTATLPQGVIPRSPRVTFVAGPVSSSTSSVAVNGTSFVADGLASAIVTVTARDAHNNPVTGKAVLLSATGSQNSITQPTATDAQGMAMGTLSSTRAEDKAISATVAGTTLVQKPVVQFTPGAAARLSFYVPPSTTAAGSPISPAVQVAVEDASGNRIPTATHDVTLSLASRPSNGVLSGTRTAAAVAGVATFSDLSINRAGSGYTLSAIAAGLASATSAAFDITPGPASRLVFSVQPPATAAVGVPLSPAVQVQLQDADGNLVNDATAAVTLALVASNGAILSGTTTANAVAGVATFSNLSVDRLGTGYTLAATANGFTGATSAVFNVTVGSASRLAFVVQPSSAQAGTSISPPVQVAVQDAAGNRIPGDTRAISLAIGSNPGGSTLSGTVVVNAVDGVATFSNLRLDKVGTGYSLLATSGALASSVSDAFDITPGAPSKLVFLVQPPNGTSGAALSPAVQVLVQDAGGNTVTSSFAVSIALGSSSGATLSGTTTVNAVAGVATFSDLRVDRVGSYTLVASGSNVSSATSNSFTIAPGPASRLVITTGPADGTAGTALSAVRVEVQDAAGNTVTGSAAPVTAALGSNPGGGALAGTLTVNAVAGVATFSNLRLDRAGIGYTLAFSSGALATATSGAFSIAPGPAAALVFSTPPQNGTAGSALATVRVSVEDAYGNVATGSSAPVSLAVATGPAGGTLAGTTTVNASSGVATFTDLRLDKAGSYTLAASSGTLTGATSAAFTISAGAPARLVFTVQPSSVDADAPITPAVKVAVQDGFGNFVPGASDTVSMALGANPSGGNLYGSTTASAVGGEATFSNLRIDRMGAGYTLFASSGLLTSATSAPFDVTLAAVRGSRIAHHLTDMGQVDVPADLSAVPIGAYVENGDAGFTYYPGSGNDAGTFTIPGVPLQRYTLRYDTGYVVTSARNLDLGYYTMGRPDVQKPDAGTTLTMTFTGMSPWRDDGSGYTDSLQLFSSNANTWLDGLQDYGLAGNPPAHGDTSINQTIDYKALTDIYLGNLPEAAKGDRVTFLHLTRRDAGVGGNPDAGIPPSTYLAAVDSFTTSTLTIPSGGDASVSGSFSPLPQTESYSVDWKLDEATPDSFGSFRQAVHPSAITLYPLLYLSALPTGTHGFYGPAPDLVAYDTTPAGPQADQALTFTYGNPFPSWERMASAYMYFYNRVYVPKPDGGVASTITSTYIRNTDRLATFPASPLRPGVSPPRTPTVNGLSAHSDVTIDATPFIAWQAPARGVPTYYRLRFRELYLTGTGSARAGTYTGYLRTTSTSVRVPPGMLVPGKMYVMYLSAVQTPVDLETAPYDLQFPHNEAFTLSGLLTVQ